MKLTSLAVLSLLAALSFAPPSLAASDPYVVSGVDYSNPWNSEFYFDSTKGSTLVNYGTSVDAFIDAWRENAEKTDNVKDLTFLGKWASRVDTTTSWYNKPVNQNNETLTADNIDAYAVKQLVSISSTSGDTGTRSDKGMSLDGNMCWAHTAANMLQYWQCYYGIFATNSGNMQHGYAVENADTAKTMLGVQSLNTTKWFYEKFTNNGGVVSSALGLYLDRDPNYSEKSLQVFGDYFSSASAATIVKSASTIDALTNIVLNLMSVDKAVDGTLSTISYGHLIGLDIAVATREGSGHSLTMYGFGLGENGQINSLIYADSNVASGLHTVYVKENNGALVLYEDSLCQRLLGGEAWQISNLTAINTPDSLKDMGRQYAENDLVWHGGETWKAGQGTGSMATAMPTDATGWQVSVNGDYYNSYFDASRNVRFNDVGHTAASTVKISGEAKAHNMTIDAVDYDYTFTQSTETISNSIALTGDLIKSGAATATIQNLGITAAGLSVKGGTLALGNSANLTVSGTSNVVRGGTLSMQGGTASLETANFAAGSVLKASGTGSTLTASTLTFADGARFSFDLAGAENTSSLLTINCSNIKFGSNISFDFSNGSEGTTYNLISFTESLTNDTKTDWSKKFVSYNGTLSFVGNTLTLNYAAEKEAIWSGNTNTWSSSSLTQWSSNPEGASVTFGSDNAGTVTISGTVNPSAINVTGGSYEFVSDASEMGSISGSRTLTVSDGASLVARLNLGERAIIVKGTGSSFAYNTSGSVSIAEFNLGQGTSATFGGAAVYDIMVPTLEGNIEVKDTASVVFHGDADIGPLKISLGEDTKATFRNASDSGVISYSLADNLTQGRYVVGDVDDRYGTKLVVGGASDVNVSIQKGSFLQTSGSYASGFVVSGDGTLLVADGTSADFGSASYGTNATRMGVALQVAGTANIYSQTGTLNFEKSWDVSGTINLDHSSSYAGNISLSRLSLNGGKFYSILDSNKGSTVSIGEMSVAGTSSFRIASSASTYGGNTGLKIGQISGSGKLVLDAVLKAKNDLVSIDKIDGFRGDISFNAGYYDEYNCSSTSYHSLSLGEGEMSGVLSVILNMGKKPWDNSTQEVWHNYANIACKADLKVGGLSSSVSHPSTEGKRFDNIRLAGGECDLASGVIKTTDGTRYTLTVKTQGSSDDHTFTGHVGEGLNLAKQGEGKQSFVGDLSKFNGDLEVKGGTLVMTSSASYGVTLDDKSNTTTLNTTSLSISGGATLESNLTVKVRGAFVSKAYVSDLVGTAAAATLLLGDAVGTTATTNPVASLTADTDLREVSSLDMETTVDLGGKSLTLWSGRKELTLSDSMFELQTDGTYKVTLFTNIGTLTGLDSDFVLADTNFTTQQGWLSDGVTLRKVTTDNSINLVLANIQYIPEPTTATLALLGLMGLCARRRRKK